VFLFKSKAERLQDQAIRAAESGDAILSMRLFDEAVQLEPENGTIRYNAALTYSRLGDISRAREEYKLAIRFAPVHADSYFGLATSLYPEGPDWKTAIYYRAYLELSSSGEKAAASRKHLSEFGIGARSFDVAVWLKSAEVTYEAFVKHMGESGRAFGGGLANVDAQERAKIAQGINEWLVTVAPQKALQWAAPHFRAGLDLADKQRFRLAIAQLFTGLEILPGDHSARCLLAHTFALAGDYDLSSQLLQLVDLNKISLDGRQLTANQLAMTKAYIDSHWHSR
jgi:tetratricopeptide (TPR) repeat protein